MSEATLYFIQQLINGLTIGSAYALIAIGYTMVYGIIGMINFAHGEIYMIGAYTALIAITGLATLGVAWLPLILIVALVCAVIVSSAMGWAVERVAYRPVRGRHRLIPLISAMVCPSSCRTMSTSPKVPAMSASLCLSMADLFSAQSRPFREWFHTCRSRYLSPPSSA